MRPTKDYLHRVNIHSRRSAGKSLYDPKFYFGQGISPMKKDSPPLVKSEDEDVDLTDIEWKKPKEELDFNLEDSSFSVLHTELCVEIFQRLSINDLKSCCAVNRSLYNSLTNPDFAFLHHNYQVQRSTSTALFLSLDTIDFFTTELEDHNTCLSVKPLKFVNFDKCFSGANHHRVCDVIGTVNGLICFTGDHLIKGSSPHYLITNPITHESIVLPKSKRHNVTAGGSGFGYSPTTKEHKVIRVIQSTYMSCFASGQFEATAEIFTLGTQEWRDIWTFPYITDFTSQAQVNGCLHWLSFTKEDLLKGNYLYLSYEQAPRRVIVAFDVGSESYRFIHPPQSSTQKHDINKSILVLEEKLCFLDCDIEGANEIWSMEIYGNHESWSKKYVINDLEYHYKMSYVYEFPDHVILAQSSIDKLRYFDPYSDSWQSILIEGLAGLPRYHEMRPIVFSPTLLSPRNAHHLQAQSTQSDGDHALHRNVLSECELKALEEGDLDEIFFEALSHAIDIRARIAFTKKNERAGLLKLDRIEDNAYKRLGRWLVDEIFKLDDEYPEVGDLLKRAAGFLKKKPNLFMSLLKQVVNTRYDALVKRFDKVLNADDGVPQEYVLNLLAWLHQALISERELVLVLLHPDAAMDTITRPVARRCLQIDSAMVEPGALDLLNQICEGVSHSFNAKVNRIFWQSQIDHKVAYELCDLLGFFSAAICDSLGGKAALCYTLDTLKDEAEKTFFDIIKTTVDKLLEPPLSNVSVDVSPPQVVMQGVSIIVEIIRASEVRLAPSKCDLELVISTVLDPIVQLCELAAEEHASDPLRRNGTNFDNSILSSQSNERDAEIFLINCLAFIQQKLFGCPFAPKYVGNLKFKIADNIKSLVEIELKAILQGCGFPYGLFVLKSSVNKNDVRGVTTQFQLTDTKCAPPASLSECLSTFAGLVLPEFEQVQVSQLRLQTSIRLARSLAEAYTMVYDASRDPNNNLYDPKCLGMLLPDQMRTILLQGIEDTMQLSPTATDCGDSSMTKHLLNTNEAVDQVLALKLEAVIAEEEGRYVEVEDVITEVLEIILRCISRDEAALAVAQKVFESLYDNASNSRHVDGHLAILGAIRDVCKPVVKEITSWVICSDDNLKFNKDVTTGLIRSGVINLAEYSVHMITLIDAGKNKVATEFFVSLVKELVAQDQSASMLELCDLVDELSKLSTRPGSPEVQQ